MGLPLPDKLGGAMTKESAQDGKWPLEIDTCAGIIEIGNNIHISNTIFA